jgi:hypothetical protein
MIRLAIFPLIAGSEMLGIPLPAIQLEVLLGAVLQAILCGKYFCSKAVRC